MAHVKPCAPSDVMMADADELFMEDEDEERVSFHNVMIHVFFFFFFFQSSSGKD